MMKKQADQRQQFEENQRLRIKQEALHRFLTGKRASSVEATENRDISPSRFLQAFPESISMAHSPRSPKIDSESGSNGREKNLLPHT